MTVVAPSSPLSSFFQRNGPAMTLGLAWLALYAPVYADFAGTAWTREENGHVPFIMAICLGTGWARLRLGGFQPSNRRDFVLGLAVLAVGLALYALGRLGEIDLFASASQPAIAVAVVLCLFGVAGVKRLWFPLLLSLYLIVWPGWAVDAATAPLKRFVSETVSDALFAIGLPVAHAGAVIAAGSYELLVADACAGMNSLIALTSVGAVYLYVAKRRSARTNLAVVASLIPIAILANAARVAILVLITYYMGYEAGQSFLHEGAGLLMFAIALAGVFAVDCVAARLWEPRP